jgi:arsenical pump membrane protein
MTMITPEFANIAIWTIAALATAGVILRPWHWPEALWAVAGAALLVALGLVAPRRALSGVLNGTDVYLFLFGMMLLAEIAREQGLFDWLAAVATSHAGGSAPRLFLLTYAVGVLVTVFLSNDATAVVLTPAVAAATRAARVERPLPYLLSCAFVANAASFVLPISNPANLVIYGKAMPPLLHWLPAYLAPSALAIAATYLALRICERNALRLQIARDVAASVLSAGGRAAAIGLGLTAIVLMIASALDIPLGLPTALAGVLTGGAVLIRQRTPPWTAIRNISWSVLPLVAGLFVLVEALGQTGLIGTIAVLIRHGALQAPFTSAWASGVAVALVSNLINNLPAGLFAGTAVATAQAPEAINRAILIGVDLGPNLSVTGSLATILWLAALRREGVRVGFRTFLKIGAVVMPPALILALAAALLLP